MKKKPQKASDCSHLVRDAIWATFPYDFVEINKAVESSEAALALFKRDYLRKFSDGTTNEQRTSRTMQVWNDAERRCFSTNKRLGKLTDFDPLASVFDLARELIIKTIGTCPPSNLFGNLCRFTSGASYSTRRGVHYTKKMACLTVTHDASFFLEAFSGICNNFVIVAGNRMCPVPKTQDVDRLIAIEPSGNAFLQQAVGRFFKQCLIRGAGIDLYDQRPNQQGAFHALVDNYATLDLECASDTISNEIVRLLLPPKWFSLLNALRCHKTQLPCGTWRYIDKFSSMGNGFTFELETLIFWSLCKVICGDSFLLVYGDDIIVEQHHFKNCVSLLEISGFKVNEAKSFAAGPYFESCGKHYFLLDNVTPPFQKEPIVCVQSAMRAHNRLVRWALRGKDRFKHIRKATKILRSKFGYSQCEIPFGVDRDDAWLVDPSLIKRNCDGDFRCIVVSQPTIRSKAKTYEHFALAYKLYKPDHQNETPKGYVEGERCPLNKIAVKRTLVWASSIITDW